jgi:hydroxymethylglutaryl-CoA reductase (NADPH)
MKKSLRHFSSSKERLHYLQTQTGFVSESISQTLITDAMVERKHTENFIGSAQIPIGIAGPLLIKNVNIKNKNYYIPLATTEGALVASVNRGCKTISTSGGAFVFVEPVGITRGSVYKINQKSKIKNNKVNARTAKDWIDRNFLNLAETARKTSHHLELIRHTAVSVGRYVFVRWYFDTQDAMGMNMATIACQAMNDLMCTKIDLECVALAGNYDTDKKASWLNFIEGRGKKVQAEILIPRETVRFLLKVSPEQIVEVVHAKQQLGSIMSGSIGFNAHYANIIAALFIATGQDPAHIVEGSLGVTSAELTDEKDLFFSVYLPDMILGTIGGGTSLPTQKEALELLGVYGGNDGKNALKFAGIVAAAVLAGELSLTASLAQESLAQVHRKLGRGGK